MPADRFRFQRLDTIGAAAAEEDTRFLSSCYVDTGALDVLRDCGDSRCILIGRTGTGKSAVIERLAIVEERFIRVRPESLALAYISNSTILRFLSDLGVRLDIFFKLLWRHVFTVEILKHHFKLHSEKAKVSWIDKLLNVFKDKRHVQAVRYLEQWGRTFWEETEYRIKELTTSLETNLQNEIKTVVPGGRFSGESATKLSEEQKQEVVQRAQKVVNQVQIRELSDMLEMIDVVLADPQKCYFLAVDRLDEDWIEDRLRYRLIRALIETARDFRKVRHAKIVVAMRVDLLERVFRLTRDTGFQQEKYESLYLPLLWTRPSLGEVVGKRVANLVRSRYTRQAVTVRDIFPRAIDDSAIMDYILDRTLMRPRDAILFANAIIQRAADRACVTADMVRQAEGEYSRARLRSLADEWNGDYPNLMRFVPVFKGRRKQFPISDLDRDETEDLCLEAAAEGFDRDDVLSTTALQLLDRALSRFDFLRLLLQVAYRTGLVGLKLEAHESVSWQISERTDVSRMQINEHVRIAVHPTFWSVLGTRESRL